MTKPYPPVDYGEYLKLDTRIPTEPFATFEARFREAAGGEWDLVYVSQVFYNSGLAISDLPGLVRGVHRTDTLVVIDGYHGFLAVPTSLRSVEDRAFYLAGGYKYAMSGEGACFLHVPAGCYVILDLEYPRLGLIRVDAADELLRDVRAGMN